MRKSHPRRQLPPKVLGGLAAAALCLTLVQGCGSDSPSGPGRNTPTLPAAPTAVTATAGDRLVDVSFGISAGATRYNLYFKVGASPSTPTGVQVAPNDGRNTVRWSASAGASTYNVYWRVGAGATTADDKIGGLNTLAVTHRELTNGTTYSYVVTAENEFGESAPSNEVIGTPAIGTVFVSWTTGNDANDGSQASPVKTLARAYVVANASGKYVIRMTDATYGESPTFQSGIEIQGGYTLPDWTEGTGHTKFSGRGTANGITEATTIRRVQIQVGNASAGSNSIALASANSSSALVFDNCRFIAGQGGSGSSGQDGANGFQGENGAPGGAGSCDAGGGTGGPGGPSFCVYKGGGSNPSILAPAFNLGEIGSGGFGGTPNGQDGANGIRGNTN